MNHEQIRTALGNAGHTWGTAAESIGRSRGLLIRVSQRNAKSRYVARSLAAILGRQPEEVFPDEPSYHGESEKEARARLIAETKAKLKRAGVAA